MGQQVVVLFMSRPGGVLVGGSGEWGVGCGEEGGSGVRASIRGEKWGEYEIEELLEENEGYTRVLISKTDSRLSIL